MNKSIDNANLDEEEEDGGEQPTEEEVEGEMVNKVAMRLFNLIYQSDVA